MFNKTESKAEYTESVDFQIKKGIYNYFKPTFGTVRSLLQEGRAQLLIGLSRYRCFAQEKGEESKYIYPTYPSGRITLISDIVGNYQSDNKFLSLFDLLIDEKKINSTNYTRLIHALSQVIKPIPGMPPLKKNLLIRVQNALLLVFRSMEAAALFPARDLDLSVQILTVVTRVVSEEKLYHLLYQYPCLVLDIYEDELIKEILRTRSKPLLDAVESIYSRLFTTEVCQQYPGVPGSIEV